MPGPVIRTDIVEVYVFRTGDLARASETEFLQLRRGPDSLLPGTWQPVMGHVEEGERAAEAALRETREEVGVEIGTIEGFWQLEEPSIYFLHVAEALVISPGFAVRVSAGWEPTLNAEHNASRWVRRDYVDRAFLWPGQRRAVEQVVRDVLAKDSGVEAVLRLDVRDCDPPAAADAKR